MGEKIIDACKKIDTSTKLVFASTFLMGMLVHMYKFTNTLLNHDAIFNFYSDQNVIDLGRWFLAPVCGISSYFDLPWIIGVFSVFWIALTAVVVSKIFEIKNPIMLILAGGLLVTFPAITQTFYFEYTADGYMIAMFLSAMAVYSSTIEKKNRKQITFSILCICFCSAIYQAYLSFAMVLALCYFVLILLENKHENKEIALWIGKQVIIHAVGMVLYYVIWKVLLFLDSYSPRAYLGFDTLGQISVGTIIKAVINSLKSFVLSFIDWNILEHGLTLYSALNIIFVVLATWIFFVVIKKNRLHERKGQLLLAMLALAAIPFAVHYCYFVSPGAYYTTRMQQSMCVLYVFVGVLCCRYIKPALADVVAILLAVIILNNGVNANVFYFHMNRCNEVSYATAVEMSTRFHLLDDGTVKTIAVIGEMKGFDEEYSFEPSGLRQLGGLRQMDRNLIANDYHVALYLSNMLDFQMSYYQGAEDEIPVFGGRYEDSVSDEWKLCFPLVDEETKNELTQSEFVKAMPCWPAADSVVKVKDTIIIKLSN